MMDILTPVMSVAGAIAQCPKKLAQMAGNKLEETLAKNPAKRDPLMSQLDGQFLSCPACAAGTPCGKSASPAATAIAKRPTGCISGNLPKTVFVNGIQNTPESNCKTAKLLADTTCSEVVSFYNATDGMSGDLSECITNIKRTRNAAADNLADYIKANMDGGVNIVAHSQGGLITRQALTDIQKELVTDSGLEAGEAAVAMKKITITSCGTAQNGWPAGPGYTQYTNAWDLVPKAIAVGDAIYGYDEATNVAPEEDIVRNKFVAPFTKKAISGLPGHGMDGVYLDRMQKDIAAGPKICRCK